MGLRYGSLRVVGRRQTYSYMLRLFGEKLNLLKIVEEISTLPDIQFTNSTGRWGRNGPYFSVSMRRHL